MRKVGKLSTLGLMKKPKGRHGDGGGLWLHVDEAGNRSWVFRYMLHGKAREMGLGALHTVSLAEARQEATRCRKLTREGIDPLAARDSERAARKIQADNTFQKIAVACVVTKGHGWKNAKHKAQWEATLKEYAYPQIGAIPVADINTEHVLSVIGPIWPEKTETASRLRGRIETVLNYAAAMKLRAGENPARWRGHLDQLLPRPSKVRSVKHHAALPYAKLQQFLLELRSLDGLSARALEFAILTACRTNEVIAAKWSEFDLRVHRWTIPAERMKARREHRVPLSRQAVELLRNLQRQSQMADSPRGRLNEGESFVFPGETNGHLSNMAMLQLLKRAGHADITVHGFRSTFRDWCAETTTFPRDAAEMALAHAIKDKTESAYRRGDLYAQRTQLMQAWADFGDKARGGKVVHFGRKH